MARKFAPALQFEHAVTLARRRTLGERQAARRLEHLAEEHRLVVDRDVMGFGKLHEGIMAEEGPGRSESEPIVDRGHRSCSLSCSFLVAWLSYAAFLGLAAKRP